jgi:hypothetical protein
MRLRADFWVAAYLRACRSAGAFAVLRKRGAAEAGAIFVKVDRLDGRCALYGPAPQSELDVDVDGIERRWTRMHKESFVEPALVESRLTREIKFDPDLWIVEVEDRAGRSFLDLAE